MKAESQFSDRHIVSTGHHLAADAAREILDAGGNAVDAGVCGGICLAVLLSEYVNFAGVAPIIYRDYMTCGENEIKDLRVLQTILGGNVVFPVKQAGRAITN